MRLSVVNAVKAIFRPRYAGDGQCACGQVEVIAVAQRIGYRIIVISVHNYRSHIGYAHFKGGKVTYFLIRAAKRTIVQYNLEVNFFVIVYVAYVCRDFLFVLFRKPLVAYAVTVNGGHIKGVVIYGQRSLRNHLGDAARCGHVYIIVVLVQHIGQNGLYFKGNGSTDRNSGSVRRAAVISGAYHVKGDFARKASAVIRDSRRLKQFRFSY